MSEESYNVGDLVEAVKGEKFARSRLIESQYKSSSEALGLYLDGFTHIPFVNSNVNGRDGWTFTTVEKAKPPLPTEPGFYLSHQRRLWTLEFNGGWRDDYDVPCDFEVAGKFAPFTRLEPVAETAKRFRDRVLEEFKVSNFVSYESDVAVVAKEFGVTS